MKSTDLVRKRLVNEYLILGSYARLAEKYHVNARYVWDFIVHEVVPPRYIWRMIRRAWWLREATDNLIEWKENKQC